MKLPRIIGHRGLCRFAPENTLASLQAAHTHGVNWVEFDVALTQDGEAIVMHDEKLRRTTGFKGLVAKHTYSEIVKLDAGSWFSSDFKGEKIPTFVEYLKRAADLDLSLNVEIKPTAGQAIPTAYKAIEILEKHWPNFPNNLLVSSFSWESLAIARAMHSNLALSLLLDKWKKDWKIAAKQLNCVAIGVKATMLTAKKVSELKAQQLYVLTYTVNDLDQAKTFFHWGVDSIFSDGGVLPSML